MNVLLDTQPLLWLLAGDETVPPTIRNLLGNKATKKYISAVSFWEMAVKAGAGKLQMAHPLKDLPRLLLDDGFTLLPLLPNHALAEAALPFHHKDPFDRLLIAQAQSEDLILLTKNPVMGKYVVRTAW